MGPSDEVSQAERRRIMTEERRMRTYHGQATAGIEDDRGGRYAASGSSPTVTGSSPIRYPAQPAHSPWHHDPIGTEPPLGYSVEAQEPVGEVFERSPPSAPVDGGEVDDRATATSPVIRSKLIRRM